MVGTKIFCVGMMICCSLVTPAQAQLFQSRSDPTEDLFLIAPRALMRLLREGETAIAEGRYAEGITALSSLLLDESPDLPEDVRGQDFFVEQGARGLFDKSVKGEAIRLLGDLPPEGRRTLEVQFGVTARQSLDAAIEAQDFAAIGDVARKYIHTEAGYDAQALLAQYKLTSGYPLAAAGILQALLDYPAARSRFGPPLAQATSQAWLLAGTPDKAALTLKRAASYFPGGSIELDGQQIPLDFDTDWGSILRREAASDAPRVDKAANRSWMMSGGSPERNAYSKAGMPLSTARWVREIHSSLPEQNALLRQAEMEAQKGKVLLPKFELRIVDDLILTKTTDASLLAIDFETGNIQWPFYFHAAPVPLTNVPFAASGLSNSPVSEELQVRVWGSSAFGKFSCEEERFYFVSAPSDQPLSKVRTFRTAINANESNYLEGASIPAQGAILWRVGGDSGVDEPALAGAYFLGPPLPYEGELYTLVEMKGETKLAVLDAATGRLQWMQQLVHSMMPPLRFDPERRSQALSPTIAEGVILCPTGVGAVVGVDLLSRRLRWGATYTTNRGNENNAFRQRGAFGFGSEYSPLERRWLETGMIAEDGVVLISPPESNDMFCRDILTGEPRLAPQRRNSARYIAGLHDGNVIAVGERQVTAVELGSGSLVWECEFPNGSTLAGKGLWQSDSLILPLSDQRVIRVRIDDGQITDQTTVDQSLGNLFAYKDQLLSVSATAVSAFYTRDALAEQVARRLADPTDTWALNQKSQLALAEGDLDQAIASLAKSFEIDPASADTRYLLVETLLAGLSQDFEKFEELAQRYDDVVEYGPQRFRFLQQLALGKIRSGQHLAAFERLLDLIPQVGTTFMVTQNRDRELELSKGYRVDSDVWIATELARAYEQATDDEQKTMQQLVDRQLASIENTMVPLRREKLRYLQWLPIAADALSETANSLLGGDEQTIGEQLLQPILYTAGPEARQVALEMLRKPTVLDERRFSLNNDGRPFSVPLFNDSRFPSVAPPTPNQRDSEPHVWNDGMVEVRLTNAGLYPYGAVIESVSERYGRPELRVAVSGSAVILSNGNGLDVSHLDYPRASGDATDVFTRSKIRGGLLLIETSSEIAAFDLYRGNTTDADALLWRHSLFSPGAGPTREFAMPDISSVNTPFGFAISRRQMPGKQQAIAGPLTPSGIVVQIGTQISLLDALTGQTVWTREGYDDNVRLTSLGLEVAIVNPSLGVTEIVDCRDGARLREMEYRGDWSHWFSHNGLMVDYSESRSVPPPPPTLRVWNAMTGEEVQRLELTAGSKADVCENRYLVVAEPNSKLHYFDLQTPDQAMYVTQRVALDDNLENISVQRFEDRLVVLTNSIKSRQLQRDALPVNGSVFSLAIGTGELTWPLAGRLINMQFPVSQPRQSPFMVVYRFNPRMGNEHSASIALIDLRNGRLAFSSDSLPLPSEQGFAMNLSPDRQTIEMGLGARSFTFTFTNNPRPPQPVFVYGYDYSQPARTKSFDNLFR